MPLSMYQASVPVFAQRLAALADVLDKAAAHVAEKKIAPEALLSARLFPDMFAFTRQVQIAGDFAKATVARLAGVEIPKYEDTEKSFEELKARLLRTRDYVRAFGPDRINGSEERDITFPVAGDRMTLKGAEYLFGFAMPHFYFHAVTAYDILRHNGVALGKRDYMGGA
ncbi:MAG: DUF1993 family protein [Pseudorhodoplanes sp.]|nr:hypothetical protein [Pseudorhodoplanes sp.]MCL4712368.1 DUF1993 family protein [Pseudorhodoplanes sp.]GIK80449.1 MAG: hypothetical protein BroJett024_15540 [Alphaproteobacteria bacterium]